MGGPHDNSKAIRYQAIFRNTFASTCCPEGIGYAMSEKATGPWSTKGYIMRPTERSRGNHPGIIDYKGGPALVISVLTLVLNLILTGIFVLWVKNLALRSYTN